MNEKWFAYTVSLTIMMIFINSFILMGSGLLDTSGNSISLFANSSSSQYNYQTVKNTSSFGIDALTGSSSQSPTNEQGYNPVTRTDGQTAAFNAFDIVTNIGVGIEKIMLQLAIIFPPAAPLFLGIAAFAFFIKVVAVSWLASIVVRQLFFGRVF
jgi:hypothetical protein